MTQTAVSIPKKRYRAVILVMLACSILCALGLWQVKRLAWKRDLIVQIEQRLAHAPVLPGALPQPYAAQEWLQVRLSGSLDTAHGYLVGPRTLEGQVGAHLFMPMALRTGQRVLVNLGFVPAGWTDDGRMKASADLVGVVRVPSRTAFTPDNRPERNEWYWPDVPAMLKGKGIDGIYFQRLPDAVAHSAAQWPQAVVARPDLPNNHAQYAAFWFSMAGVCLLVFVLARRKGYA